MLSIKKFIPTFLAITLLFPTLTILGHSSVQPIPVSADTSYTFVFPDEPVIYGLPPGLTAENVAAEIYDNSSLSSFGYSSNNSYFFADYNSFNSTFTVYVVFQDDIDYDVIGKSYKNGAYRQFPLAVFTKGVTAVSTSFSGLNTCNYSSFTSTPSGNETTFGICQPSYVSSDYQQYLICPFYFDSSSGFYNSLSLSYNRGYCFGTYILPPFTPEDDYYQYYYKGVQLNFNPDDFYNWIINNNKLGELPEYIVQSKLLSLLEFYKSYGGSATSFFRYIPQWLIYVSVPAQTSENITILKNSIDNLYRQYLDYRSNNHAYWPGSVKLEKRNEIDTVTDNDNLTLVTDKQTDDDITLILRDILRGVISIPNQIYVTGEDIIGAIRQLDFTVNVSNNGGSPPVDLNSLWSYNSEEFNDDLNQFSSDIAEVQQLPVSYVSEINNNPLMPEKMLSDKDSLSVNIPNMSGFTVSDDGKSFSTQTTTYNLNSSQYPWLDPLVKKIKRFASILLIIGYLIHLRYKMPEIIRGE